jgi:hypothetical protein
MEEEVKIEPHPMNRQEALIARFQFLKSPHGDGLDMNEPEYNARVREFLSGLTVDAIKEIISDEVNTFLRNNQYVIPFLYARYEVKPDENVFNLLREMIDIYSEDTNINMVYFRKNFTDILLNDMPDIDMSLIEVGYRGSKLIAKIVLFTKIAIILGLAAAIYLIFLT